MKTTINELWDTGRYMISFDDSEFDYPSSISDLKKCDNIIIGDKIAKGVYEVLIDNSIVCVQSLKVNHPSGGGSMYILEVC
jgi:hypothetical protein